MTGKSIPWQYQKWRKRLVYLACSRLYRNPDPDIGKSIMVAGAARSGTTWLANIIASQLPCRMMFEPFQSQKVRAFGRFHYFQYMRPAEENLALRAYCQMIFSGTIRHRWIDRQVDRLFAEYRLVKEIRANLFLKWLHDRFAQVPLLFIIRHPCAVVSSRMQLGWATDADIAPFLEQPQLIEDFLGDKMDIIERAQTDEEKHAIIWCVSNLVPLRQFKAGALGLIYYENLCCQPDREIDRVFRLIGQTYQPSIFAALSKPSSTTIKSSAVVTGDNRLTGWQKSLSAAQVDRIMAVVEGFGLSHLYNDAILPLATAGSLGNS